MKFDNSYSWTRAKEVFYSVKLLPPDTELSVPQVVTGEGGEEDEFYECGNSPGDQIAQGCDHSPGDQTAQGCDHSPGDQTAQGCDHSPGDQTAQGCDHSPGGHFDPVKEQ